MKKIVPLIASVLLFAASPAFADSSGKAGLAQAKQVAGKWQPDAALTRIGTPGANAGGTARLWQYDFYSPKSRKCARVQIVTDTPPKLSEFRSCVDNKPISGDFVDSPAAIAEATKNARKAAEQFAKDSGSTVGAIRKARQGLFSIENRDRNTPDQKKVRVVTTVEYFLVGD